MRSLYCYIVTGSIYPFRASLWTSRRAAMIKAASMRRWMNEEFAFPYRSLEIVIEKRRLSDMGHAFRLEAEVTREYLPTDR